MTISSEIYRKEYAGNGVTTEFAINFYFLADADIKAVLYDTVDETETVLTLITHYTLTGEGVPAGGTLTMVTAPDADQTLTIIRDIDLTQETDYVELSTFPADSHEEAIDKLTMLAQQLQEQLDRCVIIPVSQTASGETPIPSAGKALQWNATEDGLENSTQTVDDISTSVTAAQAAQTAAEAAQTAAEAAQTAAEVAQTAAEAAAGSVAAQSVTIASGVATLNDTYTWWKVDGQGGADDDLDSIAGVSIGKVVELTPVDDTTTITVVHGTALKLAGGQNCAMNNQYDNIVLRCISTGPIVMREISRMNGGS